MNGLADVLLAALDGATRAPLPSRTHPGFSVADAYRVADRLRGLRIGRGEVPRGYKIGFTNRGIWARYGVFAPIWGPVWASTLTLLEGSDATLSLAGLVEARIEPEIVFGFRRAPAAGMDEAELTGCIEWVAHGVEIVHTHFDDWRFEAADTVADFALHGRLLVGPRVPVQRFASLGSELAALRLELLQAGAPVDAGDGRIVLDGPLSALQVWLEAMRTHSPQWTVKPGDVVTTGTITDAWPLAVGQNWQTRLSDPRLAGLTLRVEA